MWQITDAATLVFLGIGALWDVRMRSVSMGYLWLGTLGGIFLQAFTGRILWQLWAAGLGCGFLFLLLSKYSGERFGYGDSWMILNLGMLLGIWKLLAVLASAFAGAFLAAAVGMWRKKYTRKSAIPFLPFLLVGYVGILLW